MALSQRESRDLMVGAVEATETTYVDFAASASTQELRIVDAQGAAPSGVTPFKVLQKTATGVKASNTVKPSEIVSVDTAVTAAEVQTKFTYSSITAPVVGETYKLNLRVYNAGSISPNQWHNFVAEHIATDTSQETLVDELIASFNRNMLQYPGATTTSNPLFSLTRTGSTTTSALVVEAIAQPLQLGLTDGRRVEFTASLVKLIADNDKVAVGTETKVGGVNGSGTLKQIQNLEFFSKGNYGDAYAGMGYPNIFPQTSIVEADGADGYHTIDILYRHEGGAFTQHNVFGQVTIAVEATDQDGGGAGTIFTEVNKIINNLEVVTGLTIADLS